MGKYANIYACMHVHVISHVQLLTSLHTLGFPRIVGFPAGFLRVLPRVFGMLRVLGFVWGTYTRLRPNRVELLVGWSLVKGLGVTFNLFWASPVVCACRICLSDSLSRLRILPICTCVPRHPLVRCSWHTSFPRARPM
jgi:hypothetical protein